MTMSGKLLLFGFEELPTILAAAAAAGPFGAEVVPVARRDYNKPLAVLAGLDDDPGTVLPFTGGPLGGRMMGRDVFRCAQISGWMEMA